MCLGAYSVPSAIDAYLLFGYKDDLDIISLSLDPNSGVRATVRTEAVETGQALEGWLYLKTFLHLKTPWD